MVIFHSYVSLPEGNSCDELMNLRIDIIVNVAQQT